MTRPDTPTADDRIALFATGARFSVYVLEQLLEANLAPALIAMPGYPPAAAPGTGAIVSVRARSGFDRSGRDIPRIHVPPEAQASCAERLRRDAIDYLLVACWPYLLAPDLVASPRKAALNLHPSPLPRYRGPDPVGQQLAQGESSFGVTLHRLSQQFDAGAIVARESFAIAAAQRNRDDVERLCAARGVGLLREALRTYAAGWREQVQASVE